MPDNGGVFLVPAFAGLGAPHWDPYARGTMVGITRGTTGGHIARAALERIAFQVADLSRRWRPTPASASRNCAWTAARRATTLLMQFQADLLGVPVVRPEVTETTALGAAYLAGLAVGVYPDREVIAQQWQVERRFEPAMPRTRVAEICGGAGRAPSNASRNWEDRMNRAEMLDRLRSHAGPWDVVVIGGGATGVGCAVDAAARGYDVVLLEQHDFGKGTSSRSTKLVHGGVRYLEQGNISLVMEALKERGILRQNAPHLVSDLAFVVPNYEWWEAPFYGIGLKVYDLLAGKYGFGPSRILRKEETLAAPADPQARGPARRRGLLRRPVRRLAPADSPGQTAAEQGATLVNYARPSRCSKNANGMLSRRGRPRHANRARSSRSQARAVINATGRFCDAVRRLADPAGAADDRAQPGHPPRLRRVVPARRHRHHGAAHQRRPRDVRHPLARPHPGRHHRHADRRGLAGTRRPSRRRSTSSSRPPACISPSRRPAPTCSASSPASGRW